MKRVIATIRTVGISFSFISPVYGQTAETKTFPVLPAIAYFQDARITGVQKLQTLQIICNYPEKSPFFGVPNGKAFLTVKVNENGEIIPSTLELLGTSYSDGSYDKIALSAIRKYSFPATAFSESYSVQVQFKNNRTPYSRCLPHLYQLVG
jgi:hypothetical protein